MFVHNTEEGLQPSIIDPHSAHQGDTAPKLKAPTEYADEHGEKVRPDHRGRHREKDGVLYGLDLKTPKTRKAVYESPANTDSLKKLYEQHGTKYTTIPTGS